MENIYVRDYQDLLDGNLLAPMRLNDDWDEVAKDEPHTFTQTRWHRVVYISGGDLARAYGGPEEGGWWYDHFGPEIEVCLSVNTEEQLRQAVSHVEGLLRLMHPHDETDELAIFLRTDGFHRPGRPHYE